MIRFLITFAFIFIPNLGTAEDFNGTYVLKGHSCDNPGFFSRTIKGTELYNDESYCTLKSKTNVRGMSAILFDAECSAEGYTDKERIMLLKKGDKGGIFIIKDGWVGEFLLCEKLKSTKIRTNESRDFVQEKKDLIGFYRILRRLEMCQKTEIISNSKLSNSQKLVKSFEIFLEKKYEDINFSKIRRDAIRIENNKMGELYKTMEFTYSMGANLRNSEMMGFCNLAYTALQGMKNEYNF